MIRPLAASVAFAALLAAPAALAQPARDPSHIEEAVPEALKGPQDAMVAVDGGDEQFLYGQYLRPESGGGKFSVVLILPQSGADRNGNETGKEYQPNTYRDLAKALVGRNIASLRIDKRGVGASAKAIAREEDLRFGTYVDDAVSWIRFLKAQPRVGCIAVLGHAEGALVAALAAQKEKVCAIIQVSAPSKPAAAVLADQLKLAYDAKRLDKEMYEAAVRILNDLAAGKPVPGTPAKLDPLFRKSVQPYLISWLDLNPAEALKGSTPVLVLQGSSDLTMAPEEARRLTAQAKAVRVVMVAGADRDMKMRAGGKDVAALNAAPFSPQVAGAIADFLDRVK